MDTSTTSQAVAIIGGTSGIGLATAEQLVAKGYEVIVGSRSQEHVDKAVRALGNKAQGITVDATDPRSLKTFFNQCGSVNHTVITPSNRGGIKPLADITTDDIETGVHGKLVPQLMTAQVAQKVLKPNGSITFISAITAIASIPTTALLAAINGAIAAIVRPLAVEIKPTRVNAVLPGTIDTDWWEWLPEGTRKTVFTDTAKHTPVGRVGRAEDVADAITFLIGNDFITGVVLPCDGGAHLSPKGT